MINMSIKRSNNSFISYNSISRSQDKFFYNIVNINLIDTKVAPLKYNNLKRPLFSPNRLQKSNPIYVNCKEYNDSYLFNVIEK